MTTLTLTARGQVTFRKEVLQHLGIKPGDEIELELLPEGGGLLRAAKRKGDIRDFIGMFRGRAPCPVGIEEMNEAIAAGWAGED
jgi:bifunctional DNA-binding transcriptional regulator/antitoxin component of YhaV-PrlF toxin-antitoxin module